MRQRRILSCTLAIVAVSLAAQFLYDTNSVAFKLHATYDESITRFLNVFEEVNRDVLIAAGQLADFVALTDDYFSVPEENFKSIESVLTVVGGKIIHATDELASHAPPPIPVLPEWSPVKVFGGCGASLGVRKAAQAGVPFAHQHSAQCHHHGCAQATHQLLAGIEAARNRYAGFFGLGCDCFAF